MPEQIHASFRFVVKIGLGTQAFHGAFVECTLPVIDWDPLEVKEGGVNTYIHQLPGRQKKTTVTLKNGLATGELVQWCVKAMAEQFERLPVTIILLDAQRSPGTPWEPAMIWSIADAYPIKWTGPQLKTDTAAIAMQTLELACGQVTVEIPS
jgi:phage tail-like protein